MNLIVSCIFCAERGRGVAAVWLAPRFGDLRRPDATLVYLPVCHDCVEGWWDDSDVPEALQFPAVPLTTE